MPKPPKDNAECLMHQHWNAMQEQEKAMIRYNALANWLCQGQPATPHDKIAYEILGLVEGRSKHNWPISRKDFDAAIDRAVMGISN